MESKLLSLKGVISFSLDTTSHRAVIRAGVSPSDLLASMKSVGISDVTLFPSDKDISQINADVYQEKENANEPQYLPEPNQANNSSGWFSSIVSWGYSSVDERREQQRRKQQQKTTLFTKLKSVGEVLNIW